jgi:hypothetical protein
MEINGEMCDYLPQIQDFYVGLFGVDESKCASLQSNFWDPLYCVSVEDILLLEAPFTESEMRKTILILMHLGHQAQMDLVLFFTNISLI